MEPLSGATTSLSLTQPPSCGFEPKRRFSWTQFRLLGQKSEFIGEALYYLYKFKTTTRSNANFVEVDREESIFKRCLLVKEK